MQIKPNNHVGFDAVLSKSEIAVLNNLASYASITPNCGALAAELLKFLDNCIEGNGKYINTTARDGSDRT